MGLVVPAVMLAIISSLGTLILSPLQMLVAAEELHAVVPGVHPTFVGQGALIGASAINAVLMMFVWAILIMTAGLRHVLRDVVTGQPNGRRWPSVAGVYVASLVHALVMGVLYGVPFAIVGILAATGTIALDTPGSYTLTALVLGPGLLLVNIALFLFYFHIFRTIFWKKDLPLIGGSLFDSSRALTTRPNA